MSLTEQASSDMKPKYSMDELLRKARKKGPGDGLNIGEKISLQLQTKKKEV